MIFGDVCCIEYVENDSEKCGMELKIGERGEKLLQFLMLGILLVSMYFLSGEGARYLNTSSGDVVTEGKRVIVIDAGHGGMDPGKIGIHGEQEKEINLKVAKILKTFLEMEGFTVVMTRAEDGGLYDEDASNKKVQDMKRRIETIEEADPVLVVSIHQNSYPEEYVKGGQVFYYGTSETSRSLAETIQKQLKQLDPDNHREAKANTSYYLLKKTGKPIVIVECGFLSNGEEAYRLSDSLYQEQLAFRIFMGIMQHVSGRNRSVE